LLWRKDGDNAALGQSGFEYDWAQRLKKVDLPDTQFSTAQPTFSWRLDGLIGGRTWSGSAASFGYDAAKRVTSLTKGSLSFSQAYDRDGNVTSEGRSLTGVTGDPGTGTQSFSYDALGRVTGSSGLASGSRTYTYDRDGNRLTKVEGGSTYTYTYDRTDQLINVTKTGGSAQSFGYDAFGNMTIDAQSGLTITTMAYDLDDRLTGIDAGGTANDASFTLDALGRFRTRVIAAGTETYSYLDSSETVARVAGPGGTNTDSIVSPAGDRLGVRVGTTVNWFLPDLHGSVAGSLDAAETTVVNAIRYDAWGEIIGTPGSAGGTRVGDKAWKYQGRLDVSPDGLATPLYDMSARFYMPGTGTFSQLDTYTGSAQDPLGMNRFLYVEANPATLIGPTGHVGESYDTDYGPGQISCVYCDNPTTLPKPKPKPKPKQTDTPKPNGNQAGTTGTPASPLLTVPDPQKLSEVVLNAALLAIHLADLPEACRPGDSLVECYLKSRPKDGCEALGPSLGLLDPCRTEVVYNSEEVLRASGTTSANAGAPCTTAFGVSICGYAPGASGDSLLNAKGAQVTPAQASAFVRDTANSVASVGWKELAKDLSKAVKEANFYRQIQAVGTEVHNRTAEAVKASVKQTLGKDWEASYSGKGVDFTFTNKRTGQTIKVELTTLKYQISKRDKYGLLDESMAIYDYPKVER
jgi:RHS repeat-associated protein